MNIHTDSNINQTMSTEYSRENIEENQKRHSHWKKKILLYAREIRGNVDFLIHFSKIYNCSIAMKQSRNNNTAKTNGINNKMIFSYAFIWTSNIEETCRINIILTVGLAPI